MIYLGTIPEPTAVITARKEMRLPPKSTSPKKTYLKSPARRNPSLAPSSPVRDAAVESSEDSDFVPVRRRLDFEDSTEQGASNGDRPALSKLTNGTRLLSSKGADGDTNEDNEDEEIPTGLEPSLMEDSNLDLRNGDGEVFQEENEESDVDLEPEPEVEPRKKSGRKGKEKAAEEPEPEIEAPKKAGRKGKEKEKVVEEPEPVTKKRRGRPVKTVDPPVVEEQEGEEEEEERPAKKARRDAEVPKAPKAAKITEDKLAKAGKPSKSSASAKVKPKALSRAKLATITEAESPELQRGPPIPRNNRGLFIFRRETPMMENAGFKQTRSGRNSIKPLAYWKNERIEYDEEEIIPDHHGTNIILPSIREVVRVDEVEQPSKLRAKKASKPKKRAAEPDSDEEDEEAEPWESEPGRIFGGVRLWDEEDNLGMQATEREEEIALSSAAIITREIKGATFQFAKTLTLPFFGSGMVDLPPGAIKKPKNSRKMQMVFFVFTGRVKVMVNNNSFRIGKGGMWQVPRG